MKKSDRNKVRELAKECIHMDWPWPKPMIDLLDYVDRLEEALNYLVFDGDGKCTACLANADLQTQTLSEGDTK